MSFARKTGDWAGAKELLSSCAIGFKAAIKDAVQNEAKELKEQTIKGLKTQAPGGDKLKPLSKLTQASRAMRGIRSAKALIAGGALLEAITVTIKGSQVFIGISPNATTSDGRSIEQAAVVQEFGAGPIVIPMTPAMRRYLFAMMRKQGITPKAGSGDGVVIVNIPARPFLQPAFERFSKNVSSRFMDKISRKLNLHG